MCTENLGTCVPPGEYEGDGKEGIQEPTLATTMDLIQAKLKDPDFDAYYVMRLVTAVIFMVVLRMLKLGLTVEEVYLRRHLAKCIDPLREVQRSIMDTYALRKKADVIFWDGQAIQRVAEAMTGWWLEAMKQANLTDFEREIVMRNYRELAAANEPQLRRETEK